MKYRKLGNTDIEVSVICLGTMTFGQQNTEKEAHEQLDYAVSQGINFIDTAEMYPIPPNEKIQGDTERFIGSWLKKRNRRDDVIIASKATGPSSAFSYLRGGPKFSKAHLTEALHNNLKRLGTDYIDLYQLHWPERSTNYFGKLGYEHESDSVGTPFEEILYTLDTFLKEGKIRHFGISNETPWGFMKFLEVGKSLNLPKVQSIQNPYSLLNRTFEIGNAEIAIREKAGLLAYSPLAMGTLSGKYLKYKPADARLTLFPQYSRYSSDIATEATKAYVELAKQHNISPTQMALAFVNSRPFVTSNIIGATNLVQLRENIGSIDIELSSDILESINQIQTNIPNPAP